MNTSVVDRFEALLGKLPFSTISKKEFHELINLFTYKNRFRLSAERIQQYEEFIKNSETPTSTSQLRNLKQRAKNYEIYSDCLYRIDHESNNKRLYVVPAWEAWTIITEIHYTKALHSALEKTYIFLYSFFPFFFLFFSFF